MKIRVYGCPGKGGETEPQVFYFGLRRLPVIAILERWRDANQCYFEVKVDNGGRFLLRYAPASDHWELAAVGRASATRGL